MLHKYVKIIDRVKEETLFIVDDIDDDEERVNL